MEALGINIGYLIVQIVNFLILLVILRAWVYEPVVRMMENRRKTIAQGLEDARIAAEARASAEEQAKTILAEAQANAAQKIREAMDRAEVAAREIRAQAEADATKAREAALAEAAQERDRILADVRGQISILAMAAAQKIIGEALDEKRQHALINEFFSGVKSGKVVVMENETVSGASASVTSALPLTEAEQASIKKDVLARMGAQATISFRVDPSILGGLVIRVGDKVLDGSVLGQLESMRQSLK